MRYSSITVVWLAAATIALGALPAAGEQTAAPQGQPSHEIVLENDYLRYVISPEGRSLRLEDKHSGKQYLADGAPRPFAVVTVDKTQYAPSACAYADGKLSFQFEQAKATLVVKVACKPSHFVFEIESVSDPAIERVTLLNLAVTSSKYVNGMSGMAADDDFAVCVRTLDLLSEFSLGGRPAVFSARCDKQYGIAGAKLALAGGPKAAIRSMLKVVVREEGLPYSPLGGPFALDADETRGSYVFASVSEANADDWIALAKEAGIAQIHLIGWEKSLGHYQPSESLFPNGMEGLRAVVAKIHAAGLRAGMHTLTGCIAPNDPFVTPVPDPRLGADATFTLAAAIDEKSTTVLTDEQPAEFDTVWAYGAHGNVIRVGQELIMFTGLQREPPYGFTGCQRGAFGTKPARHEKGARADHLFVRYGCFQPDANSTLVDAVADRVAEVFNSCEFDMIYMDGAEGMHGGWRGVARMRRAIFDRIRRPVLVEASEWGYPSWPFHSRIGAWDYPNWGLKRFIENHCQSNEDYRQSALVPAQLGWWAILGPGRDQRSEFPDEIEYLCVKALAYDMPMSFQGIRPGAEPPNARQPEYLKMIGNYERLRLARHFPQAVCQRLQAAGAEFHLTQGADGQWQLLPVDYLKHKVTSLDDGSSQWEVNNRFATQPLKLRIEALYAVEPYESGETLTLADFDRADEFGVRTAASGVTQSIEPSREQVKIGNQSGQFTAKNTRDSRRGAWARVGKTFQPHANIDRYDALGVWVYGDGRGEVLNLQLASPREYYEALDDHYVTIDFTGWRYFELLLRERDAERYDDYVWPYSGHYHVYRAPLIRQHVSELNLYYNELPPGETATCFLSQIKALRTRKVTLRNLKLEVNGQEMVLPVAMESGSYLELTSPTECKLYGERGQLLEEVKLPAAIPNLVEGVNSLKFDCEGPQDCRTRVEVTVIAQGQNVAADVGTHGSP